MKLILLGAPGAGKGTQADILSKKLGIPTISTGNILRAAVKNGTPVGLQAKAYMEAGKLVPDEVIIGVINERLLEPDCMLGFILDGVPRTIAQAEALEDIGIEFDAVVNLEVSDQEIEDRLTGRRACPTCGRTYHVTTAAPKTAGICDICGTVLEQRSDDKPETVRARLATYHAETEPLKAFYKERGILKEVRNAGSIEKVNAEVMKALGRK